MSNRHKDFEGGISIADFDPLTFSLSGQTFSCLPAIQGSVLLDFIAMADSESGSDAAKALDVLFEKCMTPEEYTRFDQLLKNPEIIIDIELIGNIAGWLVEEYTKRPTKGPSISSPGQPNFGPSSTAPTSSPVTPV